MLTHSCRGPGCAARCVAAAGAASAGPWVRAHGSRGAAQAPSAPAACTGERIASPHAHTSGIHGRRGGVARVWPVQPGLVLRVHGAARAPDRTVALEAAAKGDLPDAVPALDALRGGGSAERSQSGPTTCLHKHTFSP
jgi:hypothetical protein